MIKLSSRAKKLSLSIEEFEVDKAIEESKIQDTDTIDGLLVQSQIEKEKDEKVVENTEDSTTNPNNETAGNDIKTDQSTDKVKADTFDKSDEAVAVEKLFAYIDKAKKSVYSLEQIADILEATKDTKPAELGINVIRASLESIYSQLDEETKAFNTKPSLSTESLSYRLKLTKEGFDEVKAKIKHIWEVIVKFFTKIYNYIKELLRVSKIKQSDYKEKHSKLKEIYENRKDKIDDKDVEILRGPQFHSLLISEKLIEGKHVIDGINRLVTLFNDFIKSNKSDSATSLTNLDSFYKGFTATGTVMSYEDAVELIKKDPILQVPTIASTPESVTPDGETYRGKKLPGGYSFTYHRMYVKSNFRSSMLDLVKLSLVVDPKFSESVDSIKLFLKDEVESALSGLEQLCKVHEALIDEISLLSEKLNKFIINHSKDSKDFARTVNDIGNKFDSDIFPETEQYSNSLELYRKYCDAVNNYYTKSSIASRSYLEHYIEDLMSFIKLSIQPKT